MVSSEYFKKKIKPEIDAISEQLLIVFEDHFEDLIAEGNPTNIVREIVKQTLIQKANRDDPDSC